MFHVKHGKGTNICKTYRKKFNYIFIILIVYNLVLAEKMLYLLLLLKFYNTFYYHFKTILLHSREKITACFAYPKLCTQYRNTLRFILVTLHLIINITKANMVIS